MKNARVFIGLGGNVGNRRNFFKKAVAALKALPETHFKNISSLYETSPVGPRQRNFYNAAVKLETRLTPLELLRHLNEIEKSLGRRRRKRWGPREMDLDILIYGARRVNSPRLKIPHPRLAERKFVLRPLAELAPRLRHPVFKKTVSRLHRELADDRQKIKRLP